MQRAAASLASSRSAAAWACSSTASRHAGTGAVCSARRDAVVPLRIRGQEQPPAALPMPLSLLSRRRPARTAAAAAVELTPAADEGGIAGTVQLGAMIVAWYLLNIYFNIYNKQVLQVLPLPLPYTITAFQLAFGSLVIFSMWAARLHPVPRLSAAQLARIAPLAAGHMLGTVFTNMSLGKVAVSFTHTVKASEPFFTVLLSAFFLGEAPSPLVLGSLVPIVGGVALASLTEVSFNWFVPSADRRIGEQLSSNHGPAPMIIFPFRRRPRIIGARRNPVAFSRRIHTIPLTQGRILERHGVESAQPDQECAQQAAPRRRRGVHGRHKPLLGDHRAVLPAVLPSHDLRRGGQVLPSVPPEHRPEPAGAVREGSTGRPLLPWLPEAVVHDPGEGVARDPLRGQLRQACGGHRLLRPLLPDAHLPRQCAGDWCGTGGSLPVLQAQENKAK